MPLARALLCIERTCNSSIAIWTRIYFCSVPPSKVGDPSKVLHREVKRSDCVRCLCLCLCQYLCMCRCTVNLGRQILRDSSRTDENRNGNGNSARAMSIASSTGLRSTSLSGASGGDGWLPFGPKTERCEHILSPSSMSQRPSQACVQDRCGWHRESSISSGDKGRLASGPSGD
jgi:hypothetical protein